ncbi:type II secretion system protein [Candidatus Roizmanbacteria bacterium]|nr:type II secretion system protein [Candidatus Roizmanbacteria bacterium]
MLVKKGFSLIEVLVFVAILGVFFITAAVITSFSLQNMKVSENKIRATRYAEELVEWVRGEKETDWKTFTTTRVGDWCFNSDPLESWPTETGACADVAYDLKNFWKRDLKIGDPSPADNPTQVNVTATVSWQEGGNTYTVPIKTVVSRFE